MPNTKNEKNKRAFQPECRESSNCHPKSQQVKTGKCTRGQQSHREEVGDTDMQGGGGGASSPFTPENSRKVQELGTAWNLELAADNRETACKSAWKMEIPGS